MNEHLRIDDPQGADWAYALDPNLPKEAFQTGRTFTRDVNGLPFVDGVVYAVYVYHLPSNSLLSELVTFRAGPEDCLLVPDLDLPDLEAIMRRGNVSSRIAIVAGVKVRVFPTVTSAEYLLCERTASDGLKEVVKIALADLTIGGGSVTPDLAIIAHYEPVPVDTTPDLEIIAHYEPAPVAVGDVPGKPTNVQLTKVGAATDAVLTWRLADQTETSVEYRLLNADGSWGTPASLAARVQSMNVPAIGYGITRTYQVRGVNTHGQGPWSDPASVRFQTFLFDFALFGEGQPPVRLATLSAGSQAQLPAGGANLGVTVRDRNGNVPTTLDYDRMALYVTLPTGQTVGWDADVNAGPGEAPRWAFPRPGGITLVPGQHTVQAVLSLGENNPVATASVSVQLTAVPTKPLPASALRAARTNAVVRLDWSVNATNANYQRVEFRAGSGSWEKLVDLGPAETTFSTPDGRVNAAGQTYSFQIITGNTQGESGPSNTAVLSPDAQPNRPPIMPTFPNQSAQVGTAFSYQLPVIGDPDGDSVTIVLTGLTGGLSYTASNRTVSGTPTATGAVIATVTATDALGASAVGTLRIDVAAQPNRVPVAPVIADRSSVGGAALSVTLPAFSDPDGDALTYSINGLPQGLSFDPVTRVVSGTPNAGSETYIRTISYGAVDGRGGSAVAAFNWSITPPAAQPPVAPALPLLTLVADVVYFETILPAFSDPGGLALTYTLTGIPEGLAFDPLTRKLSGYAEVSGQLSLTYSARNTANLASSASQVLRITFPTITQVRGRLYSLGGRDWQLDIEITTTQAGIVFREVSSQRNRLYTISSAEDAQLAGGTTSVTEAYSSKSTNPGTDTYPTPPLGAGNRYLHVMVARDPASYAVYGFSLENYYNWTTAYPSAPLPPAPIS
ncbi:putative Ig domain-containing protein [Fibrella aquatica]|uniref:putative Ig domain-containing protein n=1 Tax=Fibrella aquatica TaxID=3242487 RepID=UPI003521B32C